MDFFKKTFYQVEKKVESPLWFLYFLFFSFAVNIHNNWKLESLTRLCIFPTVCPSLSIYVLVFSELSKCPLCMQSFRSHRTNGATWQQKQKPNIYIIASIRCYPVSSLSSCSTRFSADEPMNHVSLLHHHVSHFHNCILIQITRTSTLQSLREANEKGGKKK